MEIRELADFVVHSLTHDGYAVWGTLSSGKMGWGLNPTESGAYPMPYSDAENLIVELKKLYGGEYETIPRQKSVVTLTKA
jgi:hypothetical protein